MTRRSWCAREASFSLVPAEEGGNPLPGPPPLVSLLCLAQDRAEDQREPWANKNTKAGVGGAQIQASGDPCDLFHSGPTLRPCQHPQGF